MGSDDALRHRNLTRRVSIHTPTWGVTWQTIYRAVLAGFNPHSHMGSDTLGIGSDGILERFNPHSHMGSDGHISTMLYDNFGFNPHSHMGSDFYFWYHVVDGQVSIHTPTWGVTPDSWRAFSASGFQSTLPHGE